MCMQYTVRGITRELDLALKAAAKRLGKSVNQVALEALTQSVGKPLKRRSLRAMPGSWSKAEADAFERFLHAERRVDDELWR